MYNALGQTFLQSALVAARIQNDLEIPWSLFQGIGKTVVGDESSESSKRGGIYI